MVNDGEATFDYLYWRGRFAGREPALPTVIFPDLKMPKVEGLAVLPTVKADLALKPILIVMLTSLCQSATSSRATSSA